MDFVKQILNTDCLGSWWTVLSQHFVRPAPTGSITSRGLTGERYFCLIRFSYFLCCECHGECLQVVIVERGCAQQSYQHQALVRGKWRTVTTVLEEVPDEISVLWSPAGRNRYYLTGRSFLLPRFTQVAAWQIENGQGLCLRTQNTAIVRRINAMVSSRLAFYAPNIAKGTTDPRVEFISQVPHKSWPNFNFGISIKH